MSWFFANPTIFQNGSSQTITNNPINLGLLSTQPTKQTHTPIGTSESLFAILFVFDGSAADQYLHYPDQAARDSDFILAELSLNQVDPTKAGWFAATPSSFNNANSEPIANQEINLDVPSTYSATTSKSIGTSLSLPAIQFDVTNKNSSQFLYYPDVITRDADLVLIQATTGSVGNVQGTKHNYIATTNPTLFQDSDAGYSVGSVWINTTLDKSFICVDATIGAAVWKRLDTSLDIATTIGSFTSTTGNQYTQLIRASITLSQPEDLVIWAWVEVRKPNSKGFVATRLQHNDNTTFGETTPDSRRANRFVAVSYMHTQNFAAGTHTFDLDFASDTSGQKADASRYKIIVFKIKN